MDPNSQFFPFIFLFIFGAAAFGAASLGAHLGERIQRRRLLMLLRVPEVRRHGTNLEESTVLLPFLGMTQISGIDAEHALVWLSVERQLGKKGRDYLWEISLQIDRLTDVTQAHGYLVLEMDASLRGDYAALQRVTAAYLGLLDSRLREESARSKSKNAENLEQ